MKIWLLLGLLVLSSSLPIISVGVVEYPLIVFDEELSGVIAEIFMITVTVVSPHLPIDFSVQVYWVNTTMQVYYEHCTDYLINAQRQINVTELNLDGYVNFEFVAVDGSEDRNSIFKTLLFDNTKPSFKMLTVDKTELSSGELLKVNYEIIEDNFALMKVFIDDLLYTTRMEIMGYIEIATDYFYVPLGMTQKSFTLLFIAYDSAGNNGTVTKTVLFRGTRGGISINPYHFVAYIFGFFGGLAIVGIVVGDVVRKKAKFVKSGD